MAPPKALRSPAVVAGCMIGLLLLCVLCAIGSATWIASARRSLEERGEREFRTITPRPTPTSTRQVASTALPTVTARPRLSVTQTPSPLPMGAIHRELVEFTTEQFRPTVEANDRLDDVLTLAIEQGYERLGDGVRWTLADGSAMMALRLTGPNGTGLVLWWEHGGRRAYYLLRLSSDGTLTIRDQQGWVSLGPQAGQMTARVHDGEGALLWTSPLPLAGGAQLTPTATPIPRRGITPEPPGWRDFVACLRASSGIPSSGIEALTRLPALCRLAEEGPANAWAELPCVEAAMQALVESGPGLRECLLRR